MPDNRRCNMWRLADYDGKPEVILDFKRIRTEGYCYIDKTGYILALGQSGAFLFLVRPRLFPNLISRRSDF